MAALQTMLKQPSDLAIPGGEKIWSQCSVVGLHDRAVSVNLGPFHHHNYVSKVLQRVWHARPLELWCWCWCCCFCWCWSSQASPLSLFLKVIFPRYYGEFGMPDLWNHTNCPDPCLTYSCPKVFIYSTKVFWITWTSSSISLQYIQLQLRSYYLLFFRV